MATNSGIIKYFDKSKTNSTQCDKLFILSPSFDVAIIVYIYF